MKIINLIGLSIILISQGLAGCIEKNISGEFYGSFYINDCGEPKGGFEYVENYYANLTIDKGFGKLILEVKSGTEDKITKHEYLVLLKEYTPSNMVLSIDCRKVELEWIEYDEVWNKWHNYYIASFGINMDKDERIGKIKPNIFPGIYDHYYVELRLPKIQ
jgi:hypothetical protein